MLESFESIRKKVYTPETIGNIRKDNPGKKVVFCTGCYDILQSGHAVFFNQCKAKGDILVVGVGTDSVIEQLKGKGRPVNPQNNRLYLVAALMDVDYATLNDPFTEEGKIDFRSIIENLKPDIFVLNDDDSGVAIKKELCDANGVTIEFVSRIVPTELEATSTTRIIDKINFAYRAPLRIDFAGGWTDVPYIMDGNTGYVSNIAINPLIELKNGKMNFSGYPRGSGLSTSTAVMVLELITAKNYNADSKTLTDIAEDLFNLENTDLNWAIGRQDQYSIVFGGYNCFELGTDYAKPIKSNVTSEILEDFKKNLLLLHTGVSRNAQSAVEQVYQNYKTENGQTALKKLAECGLAFHKAMEKRDFKRCAKIMTENFEAQKLLAPASTTEKLDDMFAFALQNGAIGGKICGAGGGGAFVFYCKNPKELTKSLKKEFVDCFEIDFDFEYKSIKKLNVV